MHVWFFLLYKLLIKGNSEQVLQWQSPSASPYFFKHFKHILFILTSNFFFIFIFSPFLYFSSDVLTHTCLDSLMFLPILQFRSITPYRCLFLTLFFIYIGSFFVILYSLLDEIPSFIFQHFLFPMSSLHWFFSSSTKIRSDEIQWSFYSFLSISSSNDKLNKITVKVIWIYSI